MDWAGLLLKPVQDALGLIFFALFGGIVRTIYRPRSRKITAYIVSVLISVPIGVLAGNIAIEYGLSETMAKSAAVIAGIIAHDIIESVFWAVDKFKTERDGVVDSYFKKAKKEKDDNERS